MGFFLDPSLHGKWTDQKKMVNIYLHGNHPKSTIPCRSIYNRPMDASRDVELNLRFIPPEKRPNWSMLFGSWNFGGNFETVAI